MEDKDRDAILQARDRAAAKGISALYRMHREKSHLIRIGNNSVSLNTGEDLTRLDVVVLDGRREGAYTMMGDISNPATVEKALQAAVDKAAVATPKAYEPIERIVEDNFEEKVQYDPNLENLDSRVKAETYRDIINRAGDGFNYSGSWSSGSTEIFLACTANDKLAWRIGTDQQFSCVLKEPEEKWELASFQTGWQAGDVTAEKSVTEFSRLLPVCQQPGFRVEPGRYTVVLGSQALAEILQMLLWTGLNGRSYEEKEGWTSGNAMGDKILSDKITIIDDPLEMKAFRFGFDLNGMVRRHFPFVKQGRLTNLFYDIDTAGKYGRKPTPHKVSAGIVMSPGDGPESPFDAARKMGRALYIPALHYIHIPNKSKGLFTGSSRFSAVLLENGEAVSPIFSSRITDTFQNVLGHVELLSPVSVSANISSTYDRRMPEAFAVPSYMISTGVKITDSADSF